MLNARTLAQTPTAGDTPGSDVVDSPNPPNEPLRPVEAIRTKEGVIVLSNRPAGDEAAAPAAEATSPAPASVAAPPAPQRPAPQSAVPARAPIAAREEPATSDASGAAIWLLLAALAIAIATLALLLVRRKRRRTTERYAALLAGSEPIAPAPEHVGPYARRRSSLSTVTPLPAAGPSSTGSPSSVRPAAANRTPLPTALAHEDRSSPQSVPPSGISAPPVSERQWLSQRPPRSYKEPPS
jgi:DNA polymerase III subunit gamma/tau